MQLCFRANGNPDLNTIPEWLSVELSLDTRSLEYQVWVVPWIAEPALALGTLELDGTIAGWINYLEIWGFKDIIQVDCFEFFNPRADRDR